MKDRTRNYIRQNRLIKMDDSLLLTVSGGVDSMVMLDIFRVLGYGFTVAHCNFSLRGKESDDDQKLVELFCDDHNIRCISRRFETKEYAAERGISIQMAARDLRFSWFEELRQQLELKSILLAHNKDDIIETFFINLARGTGIKGLTGIKPLKGHIVRPLLFASREEIYQYAEENKVPFREDSSNIETKYKRNAIRHKILPLFKELNPSFLDTMELTIQKLGEAQTVLSQYMDKMAKEIFIYGENDTRADLDTITSLDPGDIHLYELFKNYGIGHSNIDELKKLLKAPSGKLLKTSSHIILKDRDQLIITKEISKDSMLCTVNSLKDFIDHRVEILDSEHLKIDANNNMAFLDYNKVVFPITIRPWREGDWFYPFGMKGKKKLSDFFIDQKIPVNQKSKIRIFTSENNIVWVEGYRIDRRYSVTESTRKVLLISKEGYSGS